jgi:putative DNA-binding protein
MQRPECRVQQPSLDAIQRWLQAVVTNPAGVEAGIHSDDARREIDITSDAVETMICPSTRQSSLERLAVYANAYFLRLLECLRELFPCLTDALGRDSFDAFAAGYLQRHPPESYTLHRLADRFVAFLTETQPAQDAAWAGFVVDLARLELAIERVFDARGPEADPWPDESQPDIGHIIPCSDLSAADLSADTRLVPTPGLTLLEFQWPVSSYYTQWKQGERPDWPPPKPQHIALVRRDYIVRRHELSPVMHELLSLLTQRLPIGQAIAQTASTNPATDLSPDEVRDWMMQWVRNRFFAGATA